MKTLLVGLCLCLVACAGSGGAEAPTWRRDCPPQQAIAPLSMEAAREAHRAAERRHDLRFREAAEPGFFLRTAGAALEPTGLAAGRVCLAEVAELGQMVFDHEYGFADGLAGGTAAKAVGGPFRRVHAGVFGGPETISCQSCHWVGGANGAGSEVDNVFLLGDGERTESGDARNPPALVAPGVVQALGREMTRDLHRQRDELIRASAQAGAARTTRLTAKGVDFGELGASARGELDTSAVRGVDPDLVVKPFGWKGTQADFAAFATDALQVHFGIQNEVLLASGTAEVYGAGADPADRDGDGVRSELGPGPFAALLVHLAVIELPAVEPLIQSRRMEPAATQLLPPTTTNFAEDFQRGRRMFHDLGCAECHRPMLVLEHPVIDVAGVPPIDLARDMRRPALTYDEGLGGYPVWLFSDLKRHDMGAGNAARHVQRGVKITEYLTPRLWGVADSGPYLHDGRAPSFDYAIAGHDGEGAAARAAFAPLSREQKADLNVYLMSLRRAPRMLVP
jgi:mono/diheme cytochrome c family protein